MRSSGNRKVIAVRLNADEIRHCEQQSVNRSEYIRSLVQKDMEGEDSLTEKIKAVLAEMNVSAFSVASSSLVSDQAPTMSISTEPEIPSKPFKELEPEPEPEGDQLTSQVRNSINNILFKI